MSISKKYYIVFIFIAALLLSMIFITMPTPPTTANAIATDYNVYYNANGGTGEVPTDSNLYSSGSTVTVKDCPLLEKANSVFSKWNTAADGTGTNYSVGDTFSITNNTTLYAIWAWDGTAADYFAGGEGSEANPFLINTAAQLKLLSDVIANQVSAIVIDGWGEIPFDILNEAYYALGTDIALNDETIEFNADTGLIVVSDGTYTRYIGTGVLGESGLDTNFDETPSTFATFYVFNGSSYDATPPYYDKTARWIPIGSDAGTSFSGTFDGAGHTISGMYINEAISYSGLFGKVENATISDVNITSSLNMSFEYIGSIAGSAIDSIITNCNVSSVVAPYSLGGGLVGIMESCLVTNCSVAGAVVGTYARCGGIAASAEESCLIINCKNSADVYGYEMTGGILGYSLNSEIISCYNLGSIESGVHAGGIGGAALGYSVISGCYNAGAVKGLYYVGGIAGRLSLAFPEDSGHNYYLSGCAKDSESVIQNGAGASSSGETIADEAEYMTPFVNVNTAFDHDGNPTTSDILLVSALNLSVNELFYYPYDYLKYSLMLWQVVDVYPEFTPLDRTVIGAYAYSHSYYDLIFLGTDGVLYANPSGNELYSYVDTKVPAFTFYGIYTDPSEGTLIIDADGTKASVEGYTDAGGNWIISKNTDLYYHFDLVDPTITATSGYSATYDEDTHYISVTAEHFLTDWGYNLTYKWFFGSISNETLIPDATESTYLVQNSSDSGTYYCVVIMNAFSKIASATSNPITAVISQIEVTEPTLVGTYEFNGSPLTAQLDGFDSNTMTIDNESNVKVEPGTYTISISLASNYKWMDDEDGNISWTISKIKWSVPSLSGTYTYTGAAQTASFDGYIDSTNMVVSNNTQTNAGEYTVSIAIIDTLHEWADGADGLSRTFVWRIAPVALTVTAEPITVKVGDAEAALTYNLTGTLIGDDNMTGALAREEGTTAGIYNITLGTLTAGNNYAITYAGATYTIKAVEISSDISAEDSVDAVIDIADGVDPNMEFIVRTVSSVENQLPVSSTQSLLQYYDVGLFIGTTEQTIDKEVTVRFAAPAGLENGDAIIIVINENGAAVTKTATVTDGYISFSTSSLGEFALVQNIEEVSENNENSALPGWEIAVIAISAFIFLLLVAFVILFILWLKKKIVVFPFLNNVFEKIAIALKIKREQN